jgi:hypothetical protein
LWELLTRKKQNLDLITAQNYEKYKSILLIKSGHLELYRADGNIHVSRGPKYRNVISKLFPRQAREQRKASVFPGKQWIITKSGNIPLMAKTKTEDMLVRLYYSLERASVHSSGDKLRAAAASDQGHAVIRLDVSAFLELQDAYTMHRTVGKRFPRNAYNVKSVLGLWQSDLLDLQKFAKYNNNYRYVLSVIDVFSKYLHLVPLKSNTGSAVTESFGSVLRDLRYMKPLVRRPLFVQTDKGKII